MERRQEYEMRTVAMAMSRLVVARRAPMESDTRQIHSTSYISLLNKAPVEETHKGITKRISRKDNQACPNK